MQTAYRECGLQDSRLSAPPCRSDSVTVPLPRNSGKVQRKVCLRFNRRSSFPLHPNLLGWWYINRFCRRKERRRVLCNTTKPHITLIISHSAPPVKRQLVQLFGYFGKKSEGGNGKISLSRGGADVDLRYSCRGVQDFDEFECPHVRNKRFRISETGGAAILNYTSQY